MDIGKLIKSREQGNCMDVPMREVAKELHVKYKRLRKILQKISGTATKMEKKCYHDAGMAVMKSRAISIQVDVNQALNLYEQ